MRAKTTGGPKAAPRDLPVGPMRRTTLANILWWNTLGRRKIRKVEFGPIERFEIWPDNRMVIYPIGWEDPSEPRPEDHPACGMVSPIRIRKPSRTAKGR